MKNKLSILMILLVTGVMMLAACGGGSAETPEATDATPEQAAESGEAEVKTIYVGSSLVDCTGVAPQKCMQVKDSPDGEYTLFYDQIEGFTFEEGFEYELKVSIEQVENPPADGSSLKYTLVEEVSKTPASAAAATTSDAAVEGATGLTGTLWSLTSYAGADGAMADVQAETKITAVFGEDGSLSGSDGCNNYSTTYEVAGSSLTISEQIASTMMACPDPIMAQASAYLAILPTTATYEISGETLTLTNGDGSPIAVFAAQQPTALVGTQWQVQMYNTGTEAVTGLIEGTSITAVFGEDGTVSGNAGCNTYNAPYEVDGSNITIGVGMSSMMACEEGIMAQETAYLAAITTAATFSIQGDVLELRTADGALAVSYIAQQPTVLVGTQWQVQMYNTGTEAVTGVIEGTTITAVFGEDGTVSGNASCNNYNAPYEVDGSNITIGVGMSSMMACEEEGIMAQETAYLAAITTAATYSIQGDVLELRTADGALAVSYIAVTGTADTMSDTSAQSTTALAVTLWSLTSFTGADGAMVDVLAETEVTAVFAEDGSLSGSAGCNNYNTSYEVAGSSLTISEQIASTMMACPDPIAQQETAYLAILPTTATYEISGETLTLANADGSPIAVFAAQQPTALVGTQWQVQMYNTGQAVTGVIEGTSITAVFGEDGTVSGNASCNTYNAPFEVDGSNITIGIGMSTMMACEGEGIMAQETAYLAAITSAATYSIQGDVLELRTADGAIAVIYVATKPEGLASVPWLVTTYNNGRGGAVSPLLDTELTLEFQTDGNITGSAGCNRYFGPYTTSGDTIQIGALATTRAFCPEPEGIMDQEQEFLTALQTAATYSIQNGMLDIRTADGAIVVNAIPQT